MSLSPWCDTAVLQSPDGQYTASIQDAGEIAMSAPTSGELKLSNGMVLGQCNPSMVWSSDSEYLAVPQWTHNMNQRLLIISFSRRKARYASGEYHVLQLESFDSGIVRGIDSPVHNPRKIEIDVSTIEW
jgi:hypothetical protein